MVCKPKGGRASKPSRKRQTQRKLPTASRECSQRAIYTLVQDDPETLPATISTFDSGDAQLLDVTEGDTRGHDQLVSTPNPQNWDILFDDVFTFSPHVATSRLLTPETELAPNNGGVDVFTGPSNCFSPSDIEPLSDPSKTNQGVSVTRSNFAELPTFDFFCSEFPSAARHGPSKGYDDAEHLPDQDCVTLNHDIVEPLPSLSPVSSSEGLLRTPFELFLINHCTPTTVARPCRFTRQLTWCSHEYPCAILVADEREMQSL